MLTQYAQASGGGGGSAGAAVSWNAPIFNYGLEQITSNPPAKTENTSGPYSANVVNNPLTDGKPKWGAVLYEPRTGWRNKGRGGHKREPLFSGTFPTAEAAKAAVARAYRKATV